MLWLVYFVVRVVSLPLLLLLFARDATHEPAATWASDAPRAVLLLRWSTPVCTLMIWAISLLWFGALTRGMLKALRGDAAGSEQEAGRLRKDR